MLKDKLCTIRKEKGYTQADMAKMLNISRQAYNHYETGIREPSLQVIKQLAEYFNVSIDYLLGHDENEQKEIRPSEEERIIEMLDSNPELKKLIEEAISLPSDKQKSLLEYAIFQKSQLENDKNHLD